MFYSVAAPASSANLGPGFDCLAIALDRWTRVDARFTGGKEIVDAGGGSGADEAGVRIEEAQGANLVAVVRLVDLVENGDDFLAIRPEFLEHLEGGCQVTFGFRIGNIDYVDEKIGKDSLFQGRAKRVD